MANENIYAPEVATITKVVKQTADVKTFVLDKETDAKPGQFYQIAAFQHGEAPISAGSAKGEPLSLSVKRLGNVTRRLHAMKAGEQLGIRGPFGNGWPELIGDVALVAGGIGLPPLRSFMLSNLKRCRMRLFYGARTLADLVFRNEYEKWRKAGVEVNLTVDRPALGWTTVRGRSEQADEPGMGKAANRWKGSVGPATNIITSLAKGTKVLICGPPIMIKFVVEKCESLGVKRGSIYVSMERLMKCGVGKCGHCMIGGSYVCSDGPVYRADSMPSEEE